MRHMQAERAHDNRFRIYAWGVLIYHVAVILWGAFVRATGSGAGCGEHWPLCNGTALPRSPTLETMVEFTHRVTSGLALMLCIGLVIFAFRRFPRRHLARRAAVAALFFEFMEAVLGAALVLLGQVAKDKSVARGYTLSIHLINTLLLVAAFTIVVWASGRGVVAMRARVPGWRIAFGAAFAGLLVLAVSGTIAALGDTLFPSASLAEGFRQDFAANAHPFVRLRVWHPAIAVMVAIGLASLCYAVMARKTGEDATRSARWVLLLVVAQIGVGTMNLTLMAPVALQIVHLAAADALWIAFVMLGANVLLVAGVSEGRGRAVSRELVAGSRD
jgi:heme a synthase